MRPQVSTGVTVCKQNLPYLENFAEIVNAGSPLTNIGGTQTTHTLDLASVLAQQKGYGSLLIASVSPGSSGNVGRQTCFGGLKFGYQAPGQYIISKITTTLAGSGNGLMQQMSSTPSKNPARFYAYQRISLVEFNVLAHSGAAMNIYGSTRGNSVLLSGLDGTTGQLADHSIRTVGGGLTSIIEELQGGPLPSSITIPHEFGHETSIG